MAQDGSLKWPAAKVRQQFVDYFVERDHTFWPGGSVVPLSDPTLLFTNAGMNQFKDIFIGAVDPNSDMGKLKRAVNSQPCIRAGGKHNDLEDVGRDTYHHTFFEMLGTWSFGDYFKADAVKWAWEILTEVYGLPKDRLYATYFEGSEELGIPADEEARDLWRKYLPDDQIIKGNAKDNFWEMGDVGPCGPCTEIHFDRIGGRNAAHLVNKDDPMVLEIWNLVFMQFHRKEKNGKLSKLPAPHVDTGMGLERIVSILQDVKSNYDTDLWLSLFDAIQKVTAHPKSYLEETNQDAIVAYRVVADHVRCITMALTDGAFPDNVGRGFVLRRIIRRAIRYGVQFLNAQTGFFSDLVPAVIKSLGVFFNHLTDENNVKKVMSIVREEEESFARTWKNGLKHFETALAKARTEKTDAIDPEDTFVLHDRYGFPADLTALLAEKEGLKVDLEAFAAVMLKNQGGGSRMAANKTFFDTYQVDELNRAGVTPTTDNAKYTWEDKPATVQAIFDKDANKFLASGEQAAAGAKQYGVVVDDTNFYFECGGQVFDTGVIAFPNGRFVVERVHAFGGFIVHIGTVAEGSISVGGAEKVTLRVDYERRRPVAANHTTTHQLNHALREVLQYNKPDSFIEVAQRGSYVNEECLRFDFSWNQKMTPQEIADTEAAVNAVIKQNLVVYSALVPLAKAGEINSIRRNFEDKYPDPCTVICIGRPVEDLVNDPSNEEWKKYSVELCGGTHINKMGEAKLAVIISEESLMKGVRRMVMYTGDAATKAIEAGKKLEADLEATLNSKDVDHDEKQKAISVLAKVVNDSDVPLLTKWALRDRCDAGIKAVLADKKAAGGRAKEAATAAGKAYDAQGSKLPVVTLTEFGAEREPLQAFADAFLGANPGCGILLIGVGGDKAMVMAVLSKEAVAKGLSAVEWIKAACGKGGGKPAAAQMGIAASAVADATQAAQAAVAGMAAKLA